MHSNRSTLGAAGQAPPATSLVDKQPVSTCRRTPSGRASWRELMAAAERLPAPASRVLVQLVKRDPPQPLTNQRRGVVWAKTRALADELACSERTVRNGFSKLKSMGLVRRDAHDQLKIHLNYRALRDLAARYDSCRGCGEPLAERERRHKAYHGPACRMRAYRRRKRYERRRLRRKALCEAALPPAVTPSFRPHQNPGVANTDDHRACAREGVVLDVRPQHATLGRLMSSSVQLQRLIRAHGRDRVARAIRVADLEYASTKTPIRNAFGLIHAMCGDLDDTKLVEHEERERRDRARRDRQRRLRALQDRGCVSCGWWQVGLDGYCVECRPQQAREPSSAEVRP